MKPYQTDINDNPIVITSPKQDEDFLQWEKLRDEKIKRLTDEPGTAKPKRS